MNEQNSINPFDDEPVDFDETVDDIQDSLNYHIKAVSLNSNDESEKHYHAGCIDGILDMVSAFSLYVEEPLIPELILGEFDEMILSNLDEDVYYDMVSIKRKIITQVAKGNKNGIALITAPNREWHEAANIFKDSGKYDISIEIDNEKLMNNEPVVSIEINTENLDIYDLIHVIV